MPKASIYHFCLEIHAFTFFTFSPPVFFSFQFPVLCFLVVVIFVFKLCHVSNIADASRLSICDFSLRFSLRLIHIYTCIDILLGRGSRRRQHAYMWKNKLGIFSGYRFLRYRQFFFQFNQYHHVQHLSSDGGAEVLPVPSGDGFEAENSINFLGQSILFHNLLSFTL